MYSSINENSLELLLVKLVKIKSNESYTDEEIKAQVLNEFPTVTELGNAQSGFACLSE